MDLKKLLSLSKPNVFLKTKDESNNSVASPIRGMSVVTIQTICNARFIIYGTFKTNKTVFKMPRPGLCFSVNLR